MKLINLTLCVIAFAVTTAAQSLPKVLVPAIITRAHDQPALGLTAQALAVKENNLPATGLQLLPSADVPLTLGIVFDTSGSQRATAISKTAEPLREFARSAMGSPEDRAFFETFDVSVQSTDWMDRNSLDKVSLDFTYAVQSAFREGLAWACRKRMGPVIANKPSRRVLVVLTDGEDNASRSTMEQTAAELVKSGVILFIIDTSPISLHDRRRAFHAMGELTSLTGGQVFTGYQGSDVKKPLATILNLLNATYVIGYTPAQPEKPMHEVRLLPVGSETLQVKYPNTVAGKQ